MAHEKNQNLTEMNEQELGNVTGGAALLADLAALAGISENEAEQYMYMGYYECEKCGNDILIVDPSEVEVI